MSEVRAIAELGWELERAIAREPRPPTRRARLPAVVAVAMLAVGSGVAVAAGLLSFGSPVRGPGRGEVPARLAPIAGSGALSPIRVADPYGGDPWSLRVARTATGGTCVAAAHVREERFGRIGPDARFHELPLAGTGVCGDLRTDSVIFDVAVTRETGRRVTVVSGTGGRALHRVSVAGHRDAAIAAGAFLIVLPGDATRTLRVVARFDDGTTRTLYEGKGAGTE
ncbi:MAG TPA: hypothetical protein VE570_12690 [Thermoleophilaceae bacterium]|jgi:hypothetical protein|nr:hypothetical protein [Thermoleophilaceae bacterium]